MKNRNNSIVMAFAVMVLSIFVVTTAFAASAPRITQYFIDYVGSSTQGWEPISKYQAITVRDHGGPTLYIETQQYGYDSYSVANMNGVSCKRVGSDFIKNGATVIGFTYTWDCSGQQSGTFTSTTYSINTNQAFTTRIFIK